MIQILENIRNIRKNKGYSQEYIATKLNMTQSGFAQIERGERGLLFYSLEQIAQIFDMDICEVINFHKTPTQKLLHNEKVYIQIEVDKEAKEQVLNIIYGSNNLQVTNK
jgi:transcriptional regulator with XRE-family HTH domain